jgi:ABC-type glycerol-3-phosphate transport system permease component
MRFKARRLIHRAVVFVVLILFLAFFLFPVALMWMNAVKDPVELRTEYNPLRFARKVSLVSIREAWNVGRMGRYFTNSVIVAVPRVVGILILSSLAGFAFGKLKFPGSRLVFLFILFGMMIPLQAMLIPLYYNLLRLKLINNYWALIIPNFGIMIPFAVFFMRSFFRDLPNELMDAARIDGCGDLAVYLRIMLPLTTPAIASLLVLQFLWSWNDFLLPLVLTYDDKFRTLPLGLMFFSVQSFFMDPALVSAGVAIATMPIVVIYLVFQRRFVSGMTLGAIKG